QWEGNGSENLPCANGGHWVLAPSFGIESATLHVDGTAYTMTESGEGSWSADSAGAITENSDVFVTFEGAGDERDHLQLSHCTSGQPGEEVFPLNLTKVDQNGDAIEGVEFTLTGITDPSFSATLST